MKTKLTFEEYLRKDNLSDNYHYFVSVDSELFY